MMKTVRKNHTGDYNCSCTSCVYSNGSDKPFLRRFMTQGSQIDRLYYGKYIPLRERKLLERLVRTRAVYNDIRAKLISDSTISLSTKADSKLKRKLSSKEPDDIEKSSAALFELVDFVDKGAILGLSECCSCCSCSSKSNLQDHARPKHHRSYFVSRRQDFQKERLDTHRKKKGVRFKAKHIRSDPCTCTFKLSGLIKNNPKDFLKKNMPVGFLDLQPIINEERQPKQKRVREFAQRSYENIKKSNKEIGEKVLEGIDKVKDSKTKIKERILINAQSSAVKLKQTKHKLKSKIKTAPPKRLSKTNLQLNELLAICMCPEDEIFEKSSKKSILDIYKQKSKGKIIQVKNKLKSAMKSTVERKPKSTKIKTKTSGTYFAPERDIAFQLKKDSIRKFKEELRRKQIMKDWECDPECIEGTCVPEECFIELKRKGKNMKHRRLEHHTGKQEKKILSQKNVKIPNKSLTMEAKNMNQKSFARIQETGERGESLVNHESPIKDKKERLRKRETGKKRTGKKKDLKLIQKQNTVRPEKKTSSRQGVRINSSFSLDFQFYKEKPATVTSKITLKESKKAKTTPSGINYKITKNPKVYRHQRTSQIVIKRSSRDTQTEIRSSKRCFCTLKLKSKQTKNMHKKNNKVTTAEKSITTLERRTEAPCKHLDCSVEMCDRMLCEKLMLKKLSNAHTNTANNIENKRDNNPRYLLPYECEPGVCTPGNCDPYQCIKLINIRQAKVKKHSAPCACPPRKTKSTSTLTSKYYKPSKATIAQSLYEYGTTKKEKAKIERKDVHNAYGRQAVKVGSTFSFNIEFYKNKPLQHYSQPSALKSLSIKPKLKANSKPKYKELAYQGDSVSIHKNMPTQIYRKERDASISTTLKRCFCTLKLQRKSQSKFIRKKMNSTGTKAIEEPFINMETSTKGTKTKQKYLQLVKPYECEPFTCIPGECNPYECLERINKRNLKDVGVSSTFNRSEINKGSSTSEKSLKAVKTQSKLRSREKKVLTKVKKPKGQIKKLNEKKDYSSNAQFNQAVRVGSTLSFNIEFYKKQLPINGLKTNYQMHPAVKLDTRPITKNKCVKIEKLNVDTQIEELKKHNKTSTTKPLLKRCLCTLNLQKIKSITTPLKSSVIQPKIYTVNRAMMKQNALSIFGTHGTKNIFLSKSANISTKNSLNDKFSDYVIKSLYNECKRLNSVKHLYCQSSYPFITKSNKLETIKSNLNILRLISQSYISDNLKLSGRGSSQLVKGSYKIKEYSSDINQEKKCVLYNSNKFIAEKDYLTGLRQYLKGYFCTMNLQVIRNRISMAKKNMYSDIDANNSRKLKSYECEPGVCVPGECDPDECLKLISKRDSNFSKKTGSESTLTSTSSYTRHTHEYKTSKVQSPAQKTTKPQVSRVYQDQHKLGEKNAVRVGSSFTFDIEFFKKSASPQNVTKPSYPKNNKLYSSKTTRINKQGYRNRHSQSAFNKTLQKASATLPRMKRCFCTLKLQKKGRLQKERHKQPSERLQTETIFPQLTTVDRGQNSPKFKPLKLAQSLKPYECKPGICVPGQCNPYYCLEIMKRLNYNQTADLSTDAIKGESKSVAIMTVSDQKHKTRTVNAKPMVISKTNLSEGRQKRRAQPTKLNKPGKQSVRIGSSFSFDIVFHKSQPSFDYLKKNILKQPSKRFQHTTLDLKKHHLKIKQRSSETFKATGHKQSQIKSTVQAASTMTTSFMKRCFCVLKFNKKLGKNKKNKNDAMNVVKMVDKPLNMEKKTNTKHYKERILQLEPYECEPGICIPGECDPYVCEKLIKRRHNFRSKSSSTALNSTRSASSSRPKTGKRNIDTQFRPKKITRETKKQLFTKKNFCDSNPQVVKIGSNFSFDIEFFKNKSSNLKDYDLSKYRTNDLLYVKQKKKKQKKSGTKSQFVSFRSQVSQIKVNKRDFSAGINNVLKRCFCTLQLYSQRSRKDSKSKKETKKSIKNEVHSKSVMTTEKNKFNLDSLQPYECESYICIPHECDPYECAKLIKLTQRQHGIGMSIQHSSKQSTASSTQPFKKSKKRTLYISSKNKEKIRKDRGIKRIQEAQSQQSVKIGSSFSFDIKFLKNKNPAVLRLDEKPQYIRPKLSVPELDKKSRKKKTKSQGFQSQKTSHASPSQKGNEFTKTQSTNARITPPLKKCFCTFDIKRPKKEPVSIPKPVTTNASTETKLLGSKVQPLAKLLPYECEPNICVPGECNPLECLERIKTKRKQQKSYSTSTEDLHKKEIGRSIVTNKTRNERSQFKSSGHVKQKQHKQLVTSKPNRQVVRIGSNFSFNIDFYKQRGLDNLEGKGTDNHKPKYINKPLNTTNYYKTTVKMEKQINKKLDHKIKRNRGNQSPYIKQSTKSSVVQPFLKRCFCTLKLQKKPAKKNSKTTLKSDKNDIENISNKKVVSIDRSTLTEKNKNKIDLCAYECEPFFCIPGECDPYECQKRIEARSRKSRNKSTQVLKQCSEKCEGINLANLNSKKIQSNLLSNIPTKSKVIKQSNIVEMPRFGNLFNNQAVKIGSNFSFNIEFYKEMLLPTTKSHLKCKKIKCYEETGPKNPKRYTDAIMTSKVAKNHKGIQGDGVKTDTKALEVGNTLKRCFCTLKLQKELNSKTSNPNVQNLQYPQVIEVRRVSVQDKRNKNTKQNFTEIKSVGTKTKAKYLNDNDASCNSYTCRNFKTLSPQEMKVILPYTPSKFNKTPSKTLQNKELFNETNTKLRKTKIKNRGKRLTKKKSKKSIHMNHLLSKDLNPSKHSLSNFKKFICKCVEIFSHKTPAENLVNSIDKELSNKNENVYSSHKKKNIDKNKNNKQCHETCSYYINQNIYSHYQAKDIVQNPTMSLKMIKKHHNDDTLNAITHKKQKNIKDSGHQKTNEKTKQLQEHPRNETDDFPCSHCKNIKMNKRHSQPLKVHFLDTPVIKNKDLGKKTKAKDRLALLNKSVDHIDEHRKSIQKKTIKNDIKSRQLAKYCNYCTTCGAKLNNEEIQKAAGDQKTTKCVPKQKSSNVHQSTSDKIKNLFKFKQSVENICSAKGPLFEMHLDSEDYDILNKDEVLDKVTKLSKKSLKDKHLDERHGKSCRCCICLAKRNKTGATFSVTPKGSKAFGKLFGRTTSFPSGKPCVCGSNVCAEKLAKMGKEFHSHKRMHIRRCDCGSPICASETEMMNAIVRSKDKITCTCAKERAKMENKLKVKKMYSQNKQRAKRLKKLNKEDKIRSKERRKRNKEMEKKINKNASDVILVAESLIDIGKFGITACTDILRLVARTAIDPKHAYNTLKAMKENPNLLAKHLKSGLSDSGVAASGRRIRLRCLSMRGVQNVKNILERYPLTNYLLYIAHKDPKRRLPKRRPREREQLNFNCSLYMGSLRKRPFLWVYNKYPWFYPHFLSLVNVWKQFTDIALFLLAVVVWSPCIFCMEACRAIMCCFFCTG